MNIKTYDDMEITMLRSTDNPIEMISMAVSITIKENPDDSFDGRIIKELVKMNHTSVLEHIVYTFLLKNTSRSFLAQITRHRMASYTSGSQHFQDYSDRPMIVHPDYKDEMGPYLDAINRDYKRLINIGVPHEEARQVLPNASANSLLWTINARSMINFLNLRLCYRNTAEIQVFAEQLRSKLIDHFSELWSHIGPDCFMSGKCSQGKKTCGRKWTDNQ
jgi:thymidylate synthase (FAD)